MHVTTNKGIGKPRTTKDIPRPSFDGTENDIQWVEISGCQYAIAPSILSICLLETYKVKCKMLYS